MFLPHTLCLTIKVYIIISFIRTRRSTANLLRFKGDDEEKYDEKLSRCHGFKNAESHG